MNTPSILARRQLLASVAALTATASAASAATPASAAASAPVKPAPVDSTPHKIVYQLNKADENYHEEIFNSIGAMLKKYTDDISIAVVAWGPGIHVLAKQPKRPVSKLHQQRVRSLAESYGVKFIACGNTMQTIGWSKADMQDFAQIADVGAGAVMELQEKGYAYFSW